VARRLADGSEHRAVKVLWEPAELTARLRALGWDASVRDEGPFYWGIARH
jgi:demethylmenaquinone methyltransferase/2-methoxy-6-polyprenyl-1,4-benzoquinol methylase